MKAQKNLLSEAATSRYAGVNIGTLRRYAALGYIRPDVEVPGIAKMYDADSVKTFFETDPDYLRNKARRHGEKG